MHYVDEVSWVSIFGPRTDVARTDDGRAIVAIGADIYVRGWALCEDGSVAGGATVRIDEGAPQPLWYGQPGPEIGNCGFTGTVRVPDRCGVFDVSLGLLRHDGTMESVSLLKIDVVPGTPQFPARLGDGEMSFSIDEVRAFPSDGLRGPRLPMGSIAVVSGTVRATNRRNAPAMVYGTLIDGVRRCATGGRCADGAFAFVWRFQTAERGYGHQSFTLSALTGDRRSYRSSDPYEFENLEVEEPPTLWAPQRMPGEIVRLGNTEPLRVGDALFVRGWAVDLDFPAGVTDAVVRIDGGAPVALESRQYRPDIAQRLETPEAAYCGFVGALATATLPAGKHRAEVSLVGRFGYRSCESEAAMSFELEP